MYLPRCTGLLVLCFALACGAPAVEPPPAIVSPPSAPPPAPASPCDAVAADFRAALAAATRACATSDDCGCYNPVVGEAGCGGVTDATTAAALAAIEVRFHAAQCEWPHHCAAWQCTPACVDGQCARAP